MTVAAKNKSLKTSQKEKFDQEAKRIKKLEILKVKAINHLQERILDDKSMPYFDNFIKKLKTKTVNDPEGLLLKKIHKAYCEYYYHSQYERHEVKMLIGAPELDRVVEEVVKQIDFRNGLKRSKRFVCVLLKEGQFIGNDERMYKLETNAQKRCDELNMMFKTREWKVIGEFDLSRLIVSKDVDKGKKKVLSKLS